MATRKKMPGWMLGCAIGCGGLALIGVLGASATGFWVFRVFDQFDAAVGQRTELDERHGESSEFRPAADGAVPGGRMERFLEVRAQLQPFCERFQETFGSFQRFEAMDESGEEPGARELFQVVRGAMGMAPLMAEYFAARNRLLLEQEMGMGEYTYIYVMAYRSWLRRPLRRPLEGSLGDQAPDGMNRRVRREVAAMLGNQLEGLRSGGADGLAGDLEREIAALEGDPGRSPWQDGIPGALLASLEPWREELEAVYCPAAAPFDLGRNRRRGMAIHND